jgi:hypothetical protein
LSGEKIWEKVRCGKTPMLKQAKQTSVKKSFSMMFVRKIFAVFANFVGKICLFPGQTEEHTSIIEHEKLS